MSSPPLLEKPETMALSVEDLVAAMRRGRLRIPMFQRVFQWERDDIRDLFDSIYLGYPIGYLLLWERFGDRPEQPQRFGDFQVQPEEDPRAWFVVDGQQRVTSICAVLLRPVEVEDGDDLFELYFDLVTDKFVHPPVSSHGPRPRHWLPLSYLSDTLRLLAWQRGYQGPPEHIIKADGVAKAIRQYRIPVSIVRSRNEEVVRRIFERINDSGKPLKHTDVFKA